MPSVQLDGEKITTWDAFHEECKAVFGFPDFYGRNMDAWVDCLSTLRDEDGMTRFRLRTDETLEIRLLYSETLRQNALDIFGSLIEAVEAVNERYREQGEKPALVLVLL